MFWFANLRNVIYKFLSGLTHTCTKHKRKQMAYNQCLPFPVEGKAESKWWSLCCGSLKACGLIVSLYTFLFCEWVCVCVRVSMYPTITMSIVCGCQATMNTTGAPIAGWEEEANGLWLRDNVIFSSLAWQQRLQVQSERRPKEDVTLKCLNWFRLTDQPLLYDAHALSKRVLATRNHSGGQFLPSIFTPFMLVLMSPSNQHHFIITTAW